MRIFWFSKMGLFAPKRSRDENEAFWGPENGALMTLKMGFFAPKGAGMKMGFFCTQKWGFLPPSRKKDPKMRFFHPKWAVWKKKKKFFCPK